MAPADEAQPVPGQEHPPAQAEIAPLASLRARLSLIMILALIPAGIFLIFDVLTIRRDVRAEAQADLLRLSQVAAKSYGQQLDEAHRLMAAIALFPEVHGDNAADLRGAPGTDGGTQPAQVPGVCGREPRRHGAVQLARRSRPPCSWRTGCGSARR